tara:strand:+ start:237 stop:740 length:504 start_codon:yes stop_codon:yes gene_type:complete
MTVVTQNKIDILVGMIAPFAMATPPSGWLACDGSTNVSKTAYADLYNALTNNDTISNPWGSGDDSSTFALPDLEGAFLRGIGSGSINSRTKTGPTNVGDFQEDQLQGHKHSVGTIGFREGTGSIYTLHQAGSGTNTGTPTDDGTNGTPRTDDETRPFNAGVKYCIKF